MTSLLWVAKLLVAMHRVAIASPITLARHISGLLKIIDDACGRTFSDSHSGGNVTQSNFRFLAHENQHMRVI